MRLKLITLLAMILSLGIIGTAFALTDELIPSDKDHVPYTENYNVPFDNKGRIDYDILIKKIMPEIFQDKLQKLRVSVGQENIVLNRGPQIAMYQQSSSVCGYVIDYSDNQVYWLTGAINSTHIQAAEISTETPTPFSIHEIEIEEYDFAWCFGPLKEQIALFFLEDKSYLTEKEELVVASAIKHDLKGNSIFSSQGFIVGKFNFDYGGNTLSFCGEFQKTKFEWRYFGGTLKNDILKNFHLENSLPPLCALSEDAQIHFIKTNQKSEAPKELQAWKNIRMETVFVKDNSVQRLLERNYMYSQNINYNMFEYSLPFEVVAITYNPEESITSWSFNPPTPKETFGKIRVPENGGYYYMSYGSDDWDKGDITGVLIVIDGLEKEYKTQTYIRSPEAPYPELYTDYIFKIPKDSLSLEIILLIENYVPKEVDDDKYQQYAPQYLIK